VRAGVVLSSRPPTAEGQRAHAMKHEPSLATNEFCAECHQFNFPASREEPVTYSKHRMQRTLDEWTASGSTKSCQACHGAHAPRGAHDVDALRQAIEAQLQVERGELRLRLEPKGVAHNFPTGDPFRRLRIDLCADEPCTRVLASRELGREVVPAGESWRIAEDFTVPPQGVTVAMTAPKDAQFVRLTYRYAARSSESALDFSQRETTLFTRPLPCEVTR
jgi:hypothetical protein